MTSTKDIVEYFPFPQSPDFPSRKKEIFPKHFFIHYNLFRKGKRKKKEEKS